MGVQDFNFASRSFQKESILAANFALFSENFLTRRFPNSSKFRRPASPPATRDVHETFWAETETRPETHVSETETFEILSETRPRRCSLQDAGRDLEAPETLKSPELQRPAETFSATYGETHW